MSLQSRFEEIMQDHENFKFREKILTLDRMN